MAPLNEAETRAEHIDPALKAAGWGVVEGSRIRREFHITQGRLQGGGKRGKPRHRRLRPGLPQHQARGHRGQGVGLAATPKVSAQAKDYADEARRPLRLRAPTARASTASTWRRDAKARSPPSRRRTSSGTGPSPRRTPGATASPPCPFEDKGGTWGGRYYQDIAIERVLEAVAAGKKRILLTLATGTGKTFIAFQIAWKLFQSRWNLSGEPTRQPAHPVPGRPQHPRRSGLQRVLASSPRTRWSASRRPTSARRARSRRTAASSSRSSRRS